MHLFFQSRASNYQYSVWMVKNFWPIWIMSFYVCFYNIINVKYFFIVLLYHYIWLFSFLHIRSLLVPYAYVSIQSIDCILLLSFELKAILLISSAKALCLSLLNPCCVFNISFFFFTKSFWSSLRLSTSVFFFLK